MVEPIKEYSKPLKVERSMLGTLYRLKRRVSGDVILIVASNPSAEEDEIPYKFS